MRTMVFFSFIVFGITVYCFFSINNKVENLRKQENALILEINKKKETVHILRAEWAYLSSPQRIEELAAQHLSNRESLVNLPNYKKP